MASLCSLEPWLAMASYYGTNRKLCVLVAVFDLHVEKVIHQNSSMLIRFTGIRHQPGTVLGVKGRISSVLAA